MTPTIRSSRMGVAALFLTGTAATMVAGLKPILVTAYISALGLSPTEAGYIVAAEMTGATLGNLSVTWLLGRFSNRKGALTSLLVLCLCDAACMTLPHFPAFLILRLLAGLSGGIAAGVMASTAAGMIAPDRLMAAYMMLSLTAFACFFELVPRLLRVGIRPVFLLLAISVVPALLLNSSLPVRKRENQKSVSSPEQRATIPATNAILALLGTFLFYMATGALWPFIGEVGRAAHLTTAQVGNVLGVSQIAGALACILPLTIGAKVGRSAPIVGALTIGMVSVSSLLWSRSGMVYSFAVPLFMASLMVFFPYIMGVMAKLDSSGRLSSVCFALQSIGLALGPAWAGKLAVVRGYSAVLWVGLACFPAALAALLPVTLGQDKA